MRENIWYTVARTSDKECVGRVLFSIGSTELVFDNLIQFGNISISIVRAAVEADTVFSMRIRSYGGFYYVDIRSSREYASDPVFSVDQILNTLVALPFAQAGSGKQECIVSTDAYAPAPDGRTYVTLDTVQAITALKYFENGLAIGTMDRYWPLLFGEDGIYLGDKRVLVTTDIAGYVNGGSYNSTTKYIELKHDNTTVASIDARAFIKDGMVDSVVVDNGYLVITFNTDSGKEPISIRLTDIFDPSSYYTKTDIDTLLGGYYTKTNIDTLLGGYYTKSQIDTTLGSYVNSLEQGAGNYVIGISKDGNKLSVSRGTLPTKLSDFIDDVVAGNYLPIHGTADKALRLSDDTAHTAWGQTFWQNGVPKTISGSLTSVTNITGSGLITMPKAKFSSSLIIPHVAPSGTLESGETYLYSGTGEYAEVPSGGGVADIYDLTIRKNGTSLGTYNLGTAAADINIPIGWGDLTENSAHRFLTDTMISTWNAKQDAISDLATIRSNASHGNTAYGWGDHSQVGYLTSYTETDPTVPAWAKKSSLAASDVPTLAISKISGLQDALDGKQPLDADLTAIAALTGSGLLRRSSNNTWSLDTNTYLTSSDHKALTLKVGTITIGSDFNSLAAKTYTITKANLIDTIGDTTYAPYNADGYVPTTRKVNGHPLSSDVTVTKGDVGLGNVENTALSTWAGSDNITTLGTITTGTWHGTAIANAYLANSSVTINGKSVSLGGSVSLNLDDIGDGTSKTWDRIVFTDTAQTITGKKTMTNVSVTDYLAVPKIAPASPVTGDIYLWADADGNYSEIPGGGGVADIYDLTLRKNGTSLGTYNLGEQAADINIPIGWADLTEDSSHKFVSQSEKDTWSAKMSKMQAIPYIEGPTTDTTAGTWTGTYEGITALEEGLTIIYVPHIAGASTTTLNINGLGAKTCYWTGTSKMTTHYPVGTPILLTYYNNGWRRADSDTTYSAGTKALFDAGANTTNRVWSAKVLADSVAPIVHTHTWSDITDGADVLSGYLPLSGGELIGNLSMGRNAIINIGSLSAPPDETFSISGVQSISFAIGGAFLPLPGIVKDGNHLVFYTGYADVHDTVGEDLYHLKLTAAEEGSGEDWGGGSYKIYDESNLSLATLAGSSAIGSTSQPVYYNGSALAACNLGTASQKDAVTSISSGGTGLPTAGAIYTFVNNAVTAAQPYKGVSSTAVTDGGTEMPTISGYTTRTKGDVVAYNKKEFIWEGDKWRELGDEGSYALKTVQIIAGTGLAGGGAISQDVTLSLSSETIASLGLADSALQASDLDGYVNAISQGSGNYVTGITKSGKTLTITRATLPTTIALSNVTGADDLQAIEALTGTSGFLKKTAANTWTLDTNTYLTSASHKALTLKVGSITIGSDYNSLAAKTYTISKANLTDTIGTTTYAPYHADGYLPLSGGTLTGTLYTQHILPSSALGGYNIGSETAPFGSGYFSGSLLAEESVETYDVIAHGTADLSVRLAIPTSAPTSPASGKTYLWASSLGDYAETPSGGGSATVYDLTIRKNGTAIGTYNLGTQAADVNIPVGWSDLTPDSSHRFLTDTQISTWNAKQNAISDLATIRSNASTAATAVDVQQGSGLGIDNNGHLTLDSHDAADVLALGSAAFKGYDTAVTSGSANLVTSGAVYTAVSAKYTKPSTGIPKTDLASAVQTSLGKADTALQSVAFSDLTSHPTTLAGYGITDAKIANGTITLGSNSITPLTSFTETDPTVPSWAKASTKPTYTLDEVADGSTRKLANYVLKAGDTMTGNLIAPSVRVANTYYGISFDRTTATPVETILYTGIKWVSGSHMPVLHITGFAYGLQSPVEFKIGFYLYGNKIGWCGVTNMGSWAPRVYLFKYTNADGIDCVAVGLAGSCYFLQLQADVQDEMGKFANIIVDKNKWSWSFLTTAGTIPATDGGTTCIEVPYKADILSLAWGNVTGKPTSLSGYGITDAKIDIPSGTSNRKITLGSNNFTIYSWALASAKPSYALSEITGADDLKVIEALTGTGLAKRTADNTWELTDTADKAGELVTSTEEDAMFTYRQVPSEAVGDVCKATAVKGKSVVWNQFFDNDTPIAFSYDNSSGTSAASPTVKISMLVRSPNHKFYAFANFIGDRSGIQYSYIGNVSGSVIDVTSQGTILTAGSATTTYRASLITRIKAGASVSGTFQPILIDLTLMFGAGNEPATAAEFEALYPDYHSYNAGELVNNAASGVEMLDAGGNSLGTLPTPITEIVPEDKPTVRLNQLFEKGLAMVGYQGVASYANGKYTINGTNNTATYFDIYRDNVIGSVQGHKFYISVEITDAANTNGFYFNCGGQNWTGRYTTAGRHSEIGTAGSSTRFAVYAGKPANTAGCTFSIIDESIRIIDLTEMYGAGNEPTSTAEVEELIGSEYIPYNTGEDIPNRIFPVGMKSAGTAYDEWSGTTAVKRVGKLVVTSTTNVANVNVGTAHEWQYIVFVNQNIAAPTSTSSVANIICDKYVPASNDQVYMHSKDKIIGYGGGYFRIYDSALIGKTAAEVKEALIGLEIYYEFAEPETYTTDQQLPDTLVPFESGGTMRRLPVDTTSEVIAPMVCDFKYGANMSDVANGYLPLSGGTVTGTLEAAGELIIPDSAPRNPDSTKVYLYCDTTGNYYQS